MKKFLLSVLCVLCSTLASAQDVAAGYYRLLCPLFEHEDGTNKKAMLVDEQNKLLWGDYDAESLSQLFLIEQADGKYHLCSGATGAYLADMTDEHSPKSIMRFTQKSLIDIVPVENGTFTLRVENCPNKEHCYLHCEGHEDGNGSAGRIVGWGDTEPSIWMLEAVSDEELESLQPVAPRTKPAPETTAWSNLTFGETRFYMFNKGMGMFLNQGAAWGTQVVVAEKGLATTAYKRGQRVYLRTESSRAAEGLDYLFRTYDGKAGNACFVDGDPEERTRVFTDWDVKDNGESFMLSVPEVYYDKLLKPQGKETYYFACNANHNPSTPLGVWFDETKANDNACWQVVLPEAYEDYQAQAELYNAVATLDQAIVDAQAIGMDMQTALTILRDTNSSLEMIEAAINALGLFFDFNGVTYQITDNINHKVVVPNQNKFNSQIASLSGELAIPEKVTKNGVDYTVTGIEESAFRDCSNITSLEVAGSVEYIAAGAFSGCRNLASITLNEGLTDLRHTAFEFAAISTIQIPASVRWIDVAFNDCSNLSEITVAEGNPYFTSIDGALYTKDGKMLKAYPRTRDYVELPQSVESIFNCAFHGCNQITSLVVPNTVTTISGWAFGGMWSVRTIILPESVTEFQYSEPFWNTPLLSSLYLYNPISLNSPEKDFSSCILYVPQGSKEQFLASEFYESDYSRMANIVEVNPLMFNANVLYAKDVIATPGESLLPIVLRNTNDVDEVEFEITMPKGVTVTGCQVAAGSAEGLTITQDFSSGQLSAYTISGATIAKGDSIVANLVISVADNIADGAYPVKMGNIVIYGGEKEWDLEDFTSTLRVKNIQVGQDIAELLKNGTFDPSSNEKPEHILADQTGFNGWMMEFDESDGKHPKVREGVPEIWLVSGRVWQTVENLPLGYYQLQTNAYYQPGFKDINEAYQAYLAGEQENQAYIYVNDDRTVVPSIWEGLGDNHGFSGENVKNVEFEDQTFYIPARQISAKTWFEAGEYATSVIGECTDGTLTLGFSKTSADDNSTWFAWNDQIQLTYLGRACLYANEVQAVKGGSVVLPIALRNIDVVSGFQFQLEVPDGITVESVELAERASGLEIDNKKEVLALSTGGNIVEGNDGVLVNVHLKLGQGVESEKLTIKATNIVLSSADGTDIRTVDAEFNVVVNDVLLGDVNGSGDITVSDAVAICSYILGNPPAVFNAKAADVNGNGEITVSDAVAIVNMILR